MGTTKEKVAAQALVLLRADSITSFNDGTEEADIVKDSWDIFVEAILSKHPWTFATKKIQLNRGSETPVNEFKYAYVIPGTVLRILAVYDSSSTGIRPVLNYEIQQTTEGRRILSNDEAVYIDAIFNIDPGEWPPYFTEFAAYAFASHISIPVTDDEDMESKFYKLAYGTGSEGERGGKFASARNIDDQQKPSEELIYNEIINARFS